ncbi:MAG: hypothetical protein LQ346_003810 [Caloplaca aetnensis]|nr:MAG: hypothetical protein LQ346_003810 [Caloplaca aetnensis]
MAQDLPPTGGYEPIQYKRNIPIRGFRPSYYLAAMAAFMGWGLYKYGKGVREHKYDGQCTHPLTQIRYPGMDGG